MFVCCALPELHPPALTDVCSPVHTHTSHFMHLGRKAHKFEDVWPTQWTVGWTPPPSVSVSLSLPLPSPHVDGLTFPPFFHVYFSVVSTTARRPSGIAPQKRCRISGQHPSHTNICVQVLLHVPLSMSEKVTVVWSVASSDDPFSETTCPHCCTRTVGMKK